jgi:archaellin
MKEEIKDKSISRLLDWYVLRMLDNKKTTIQEVAKANNVTYHYLYGAMNSNKVQCRIYRINILLKLAMYKHRIELNGCKIVKIYKSKIND